MPYKTFVVEQSGAEKGAPLSNKTIVFPVGHGYSSILVREFTDGKEDGAQFFATMKDAEDYMNKIKNKP